MKAIPLSLLAAILALTLQAEPKADSACEIAHLPDASYYEDHSSLGYTLPDIPLEWYGEPFDLKGKWLLLAYTSECCGGLHYPDTQDIERLSDIYTRYGKQINILALTWTSAERLKVVTQGIEMTYPLAYDPDHRWGKVLGNAYEPSYLLFNPAGQCAWEGDLAQISDALLAALPRGKTALREAGFYLADDEGIQLLLPIITDNPIAYSFWSIDSEENAHRLYDAGVFDKAEGGKDAMLKRFLEAFPPSHYDVYVDNTWIDVFGTEGEEVLRLRARYFPVSHTDNSITLLTREDKLAPKTRQLKYTYWTFYPEADKATIYIKNRWDASENLPSIWHRTTREEYTQAEERLGLTQEYDGPFDEYSRLGHTRPDAPLEWLSEPTELKNKWLLLEFWGTYCGPCIRQMPRLNEIHQKFGQDLAVVGITSEAPAKVVARMRKSHIAYPVANDPAGKWQEHFNIFGVPTTILVNPQGQCVWEGELDELPDALLNAFGKGDDALKAAGYRLVTNKDDGFQLLLPIIKDDPLEGTCWRFKSHESFRFADKMGWLKQMGFDDTFAERACQHPESILYWRFANGRVRVLGEGSGLGYTINSEYFPFERDGDTITIVFRSPTNERDRLCYKYLTLTLTPEYTATRPQWIRRDGPPLLLWHPITPEEYAAAEQRLASTTSTVDNEPTLTSSR